MVRAITLFVVKPPYAYLVYHRVYDDVSETTSKSHFDKDDTSLGRIDVHAISPPRAVSSLKSRLLKAEDCLGDDAQDMGSDSSMDDSDVLVTIIQRHRPSLQHFKKKIEQTISALRLLRYLDDEIISRLRILPHRLASPLDWRSIFHRWDCNSTHWISRCGSFVDLFGPNLWLVTQITLIHGDQLGG